MKKEEIEKWIKEKQEEERRKKWVQARCIAIGLIIYRELTRFASWALDNIPPLQAAWDAYLRAKGAK